MKKSRHNAVSFASVDDEARHNNIASWSEYMDYFPQIGISPSSVSGAAITVFLMALIGVLYTIVYLVFVAFRILVRTLQG